MRRPLVTGGGAACCGPWEWFDTAKAVPHPSTVLSFSHRLSAVFLALALATGQSAVCAGWMPSAEARMACCADDGSCPMHTSDSDEDRASRILTQTEADRCCAASEPGDSSPSPSSVAFHATPGAVLISGPALFPEPEPHGKIWRAPVPIAATHVPKHLLLTVFLV